jgi:hypothetical protein
VIFWGVKSQIFAKMMLEYHWMFLQLYWIMDFTHNTNKFSVRFQIPLFEHMVTKWLQNGDLVTLHCNVIVTEL